MKKLYCKFNEGVEDHLTLNKAYNVMPHNNLFSDYQFVNDYGEKIYAPIDYFYTDQEWRSKKLEELLK
jgi:hypothetical protein